MQHVRKPSDKKILKDQGPYSLREFSFMALEKWNSRPLILIYRIHAVFKFIFFQDGMIHLIGVVDHDSCSSHQFSFSVVAEDSGSPKRMVGVKKKLDFDVKKNILYTCQFNNF